MAVCVMHLPAVVIGDDGLPFVGCVACPHAYPWDEAPADLIADCEALLRSDTTRPVAVIDRPRVPSGRFLMTSNPDDPTRPSLVQNHMTRAITQHSEMVTREIERRLLALPFPARVECSTEYDAPDGDSVRATTTVRFRPAD